MTTRILRLLASAAALAAAAEITAAEAASKNAAAPAAETKQQKLVRVSTLATVEANREFQANVQLLQAQRQAAVELNTAIEREKDAAKQKELKGRLEALMTKLNENNALMRKTYGFSLDRNYSVVIEKAHVYMFVSEEEAAQIEQAAAKKK